MAGQPYAYPVYGPGSSPGVSTPHTENQPSLKIAFLPEIRVRVPVRASLGSGSVIGYHAVYFPTLCSNPV